MSEHFRELDEEQDIVKNLRLAYEEVILNMPNIMKGIRKYGSFVMQDSVDKFLREQLKVSFEKHNRVEKLFALDEAGIEIWRKNNFVLHEDISLTTLLETSRIISASTHGGEQTDSKFGLIMPYDEKSWLCIRLDRPELTFSVQQEGAEQTDRYEIVITERPKEIDWTNSNLWE